MQTKQEPPTTLTLDTELIEQLNQYAALHGVDAQTALKIMLSKAAAEDHPDNKLIKMMETHLCSNDVGFMPLGAVVNDYLICYTEDGEGYELDLIYTHHVEGYTVLEFSYSDFGANGFFIQRQ